MFSMHLVCFLYFCLFICLLCLFPSGTCGLRVFFFVFDLVEKFVIIHDKYSPLFSSDCKVIIWEYQDGVK